MKIVVLHNDLRVYWRRRLFFLHDFLKAKTIELYAIELFGKGSPYDFESLHKTDPWWECLFPEQSNAELTNKQIKNAVFAKLDKINPDVIIGGSIVFFSGAIGLRWTKKNKKKFIMFDDAKPSWLKRNFIVQGIKNLITNQIDGLWLPSNEYDKEYTKLYPKNKVHYLYGYDCVDNELFKAGKKNTMNHGKIITVSRLVQKKNVKSLLKAWKYIEANDKAYTLDILGDGPLAGELKGYSAQLGLKRVNFLGAVPNEKIPDLLVAADAFVSPSLYESWGLVVNEAMAAGLPVLLSDKINAAFTLLKHGENGYLFDPYEENALKNILMEFIRQPLTKKREMSIKSLELISEMDFNFMGNELLSALHSFKTQKHKPLSLLTWAVLNMWYGRYNTKEWDQV